MQTGTKASSDVIRRSIGTEEAARAVLRVSFPLVYYCVVFMKII